MYAERIMGSYRALWDGSDGSREILKKGKPLNPRSDVSIQRQLDLVYKNRLFLMGDRPRVRFGRKNEWSELNAADATPKPLLFVVGDAR